MNINRVVISGNITREPDLRRTKSGMAVLTIGVAVNDGKKNQQTGEWEEYTNFVDCTVFGNRAESLANKLAKGMKVAIEGKLHWSSWEKDGQKRSKLEVNIDVIEFMSNGRQQRDRYDDYHGDIRKQQAQFANDTYDDDCPF